MATIFLSYSREDSGRVRPLAAALKKQGHTVWWDEQVGGGDQFTQAIQDALDKADVVVVAWSSASVQSAWVRDEAAHGRDSGKLVPVSIDGSPPPLGFREYQAIDLSSWGGRGSKPIEPVMKAIDSRAGRKSRKRSPGRTRIETRRGLSKRSWIAAALAAAALTAAGLVASGVVETPLTAFKQETPSIAVLPFADLSPAGDKAYFAEGVAEEILSTLAAERGIRVLGRSSARQIGRAGDPGELRKRLGLTHLLEGSARSAGDQLRVNVRLIDTADGSQLWEEEYQGRPADVFAVQDEVARAVVQRLRGTLSEAKVRAAKTTTIEAYQDYLSARALMRSRSLPSLQEAFGLARKVVQADPNYAPGRALLAELYYLLSDEGAAYGTLPVEQARKLGIPHARAAIRLNPEAADGYTALGLLLPAGEALEPMRRALRLEPSRSDVRSWYATTLHELGRHDEALNHTRAAVVIDPLAFAPVSRLVMSLASAGRQQEAMQTIRQFRSRGGDAALVHPFLMQIAHWQGDWSGVIMHGRAAIERRGMRHDFFLRSMAADLYALGFGTEAASILPSRLAEFHAPYYAGDLIRLRRNIERHGPMIWTMTDGGLAFAHLAALRDWSTLTKLHDRRPFGRDRFCLGWPDLMPPFALALRATGRAREANTILDCLRHRLGIESRQKSRVPPAWPADLEFNRATLGALEGDREGALRWLDRAVARSWAGQPYSSRLTDYPQFDAIRADPRFATLQRRIDARLARERAELIAQTRGARAS